MVTDHPECPTKCEGLAKPLIALYNIYMKKLETMKEVDNNNSV